MFRLTSAVLVCALTLAAPLFAADTYDIRFYPEQQLISWEGEPVRVIVEMVPKYFDHPIPVEWSCVFPSYSSTPITGSLLVRWDVLNTFLVNVPHRAVYGGPIEGTVTITYKDVNGVPQSKSKYINAHDPIGVRIERQAFAETAGQVPVMARFDRRASIPLCVQLYATDFSAKAGQDYILPSAATLAPGSTTLEMPITIQADALAEGVETFGVHADTCLPGWGMSSTGAAMAIYETDIAATFTPADVTAFVGDPLALELDLPAKVGEIANFQLSSSNPRAAVPYSRQAAVDGRQSVPILTAEPGEATITASFADWTDLPPAVATVRTFYGDVKLDEDNRIVVARGETVAVPVQMAPAPPIPFPMTVASANEAIAKADPAVDMTTSGASALNVTGVSTGTTRLDVYSPGARLIAEVQVEVVEPLSLGEIAPKSGSAAGGTSVTITGAGFRAPCSAKFGTAEATNVTVVNERTLRATTPAHASGLVDVLVTCGSSLGRLPGAFTFKPARKRSVRH